MNTENGWRVPAPNPDNAAAWERVLHFLQESIAEMMPAYLCIVLEVAGDRGLITQDEEIALRQELEWFLSLPGRMDEKHPLRCGFITRAADRVGAWPNDTNSGDEFRVRFVRWRAGLTTDGDFPWARWPQCETLRVSA